MQSKRPTPEDQTRKASVDALASLAKTLQKDRDTLGVLRQVTNQLKQEHALLLSVLQHLPCGVLIASAPSGRLIMSNQVMEQIFRQPFETSKDVLSHREWKLFHANGRPCDPNEWPMNRAIFYGEIVTCEVFKIRRADRSYGYVVANAAPLRDHRGQIIAGMLTMMEISGLPLGRVGSGRKSFVERPRHAA
ncbi:MAG: hypothetical protein DMG70_07340 [Acidobacteria bacterium]|nr:MAG: hypothetical protein DMG70_07340 [Acidobacteriota bacterium]PYY08742.1 MAG: hypothetical protein DMG69_13530 [Acidobacteriota bacterium]